MSGHRAGYRICQGTGHVLQHFGHEGIKPIWRMGRWVGAYCTMVKTLSHAPVRRRSDRAISATTTRKALSKVFAPALRFGWLIEAASASNDRYVLKEHRADRAISHIMQHRTHFHEAITATFANAGWRTGPAAGNRKMAAISKGSGATIDFDEYEIEKDGTVVALRCCVTLCATDSANFKQRDNVVIVPAREKSVAASKFWVRVLCLRFKGKDADELDLKDMNEFAKTFEPLSQEIAAALTIPYASVIAGLADVRSNAVRVLLRDELFLFAASTTIEGFHDVFYTILSEQGREGFAPSSCLTGRNEPAVHLLRDMARKFSFLKLESSPKLFAFDDDAVKARAIYWASLNGSSARLVGLAHDPFFQYAIYEGLDVHARLRKAPANAMNAATAVAIASKL